MGLSVLPYPELCMTDTLSLTGFSADLRALPPGATLSRVARVPVSQRDRLREWRGAVTAAVAKAANGCSTQTLDAVSDDFTHAIRVVVVTRVAA
jgi:hypothetical protein